jgi:hypothetical protein
VWLGRDTAPYWRPLGGRVTLLVPQSRGAACDCETGCADLTWVRSLSADAVLRAVEKRLHGAPRELAASAPAHTSTR